MVKNIEFALIIKNECSNKLLDRFKTFLKEIIEKFKKTVYPNRFGAIVFKYIYDDEFQIINEKQI